MAEACGKDSLDRCHMFPLGNRTRYDPKQRMRCGKGNFSVTTIDGRTAPLQLAQKPPPFVLQLSISDEEALSGPDAAKFGSIKRVAPRTRFGVDKRKVTVDRGARRTTGPKSLQLGVLAITSRAPPKHLAGE
jgi:hypothetical protein